MHAYIHTYPYHMIKHTYMPVAIWFQARLYSTTFNSIPNTTYHGGAINGIFTGTSFYMINKKCAYNLLKIFPINEQLDCMQPLVIPFKISRITSFLIFSTAI